MLSRHLYTLSALLSCSMLFACDSTTNVKDTLGLSRKAPDEYRVVSRPPLSVPPQFSLRAPVKPGDPSVARTASAEAKALLLGKPEKEGQTFALPSKGSGKSLPAAASATSSPEKNFLEKTGAITADPSVRTALADEQAAKVEAVEERSWWDIFSMASEKKDPVVDAKSESERLQKNKETGKPITEGATPEVKQRDRGVLGWILGD